MRDYWFYYTNSRYISYLHSKEWRAKRRQVIKRCNDTCERCGKFRVAEVHHLTYERVYEELLEDLQGLCKPCHAFEHDESKADGVEVFEAQQKWEKETLKKVTKARNELARLKKRSA